MGKDKGAPSLWRTLKGYADRGWQVYLITGTNDPDSANEVHPNIHISRFDIPWLKKLMRFKKIGFFARALWWGYFQLMAFVRAQKLYSQHKVDVVYGYEVSAVPVAKVLSQLWRVPMVSRFQGTILKVALMNKRFWKIRAWEHILGLRTPADLVIMTNDGTQGDKVLEQLGVDTTRVRFWMNGVDWDMFRNLPLKQEASKILNLRARNILLTVSRLDSWKRVDRSIQAMPEVVKDFPDTLLVVVGDGPMREQLERLARLLGVERHVRFEGAVPHHKVPHYLAVADIFLSLYDWSNVGNPLLEAMMAGKCIITLNNGDTGKFVQNRHNAVLLEYHELPSLPNVIKRLLADEKLRNQLGVNARRFAEENFWSWEERMEAEVQAVEALLR